jgi:hypothetical protein
VALITCDVVPPHAWAKASDQIIYLQYGPLQVKMPNDMGTIIIQSLTVPDRLLHGSETGVQRCWFIRADFMQFGQTEAVQLCDDPED